VKIHAVAVALTLMGIGSFAIIHQNKNPVPEVISPAVVAGAIGNHRAAVVIPFQVTQFVDKNVRPLQVGQGAFGNIHAAPKPISLVEERPELHDGRDRKYASQPKNPPLGRRIAELFGGLLIGFLLAAWGVSYIHKDRSILGACLIGGGALVFTAGMFLWWAIQIPATWGWPV